MFMLKNVLLLLAVLIVLVSSCQQKNTIYTPLDTEKPLLESMAPDSTGVSHRNDLTETEDWNYLHYFYFYNGGGVATGDINNDGLIDIYLSANQGPGVLYLNKGDFKFEDITAASGIDTREGWKTGVHFADINGDGLLDLYICRAGGGPASERSNLVYINNGDLTFVERSAELGLIDTNQTISANFFDYDLDGDLDIFVVNHSKDFHLVSAMFWMEDPNNPKYGENHLFEQQDDGTFKDVSKKAGISTDPDYSLSASITDINKDGYPDIFVANDYWYDDQVYINNGDGTFTDVNKTIMPRNTMFSMGSDAADFNNDGWPDVVSVDMMPKDNRRLKSRYNQFATETFEALSRYGHNKQFSRNMLCFSDGGTGFYETAMLSGIAATDWSWAVIGADLDNDGWKDILVTNGIKRDVHDLDYTQKKFGDFDMAAISYLVENKLSTVAEIPTEWVPNFLFRNNGDMTFEDVSAKWGFTQPLCSQGMALADLDNDGYLDVIMSNTDTVASIYRNNGNVSGNQYLQVHLKGSGKNTFGLGAKASLYAGGQLQYQELQSSRGYQSSSQPVLHFGLGKDSKIDSLVIVWPDNTYKTIKDIKPNTAIVVEQHGSLPYKAPIIANTLKPFVAAQNVFPPMAPKESVFRDFDVDRLIPHKLSVEGPALATADVNGDGNDDIFLGGGRKNPSTLWLSGPKGYTQATSQPWNNDLSHEVISALFFDANGDGFVDLYLATGSNEYNIDDPCQQDRLYLNDGKGGFTYAANALPLMHTSTKAIAAADIDGDGDLDLFVGGLVLPRKYGLAPRSYVLINDNGVFKDATATIAPELVNVGMVTTALWADMDGDKQPDLVLAGEYMPLSVYLNNDGKLKSIGTSGNGLEGTYGWWRSLVAHDFDGDGDIDLVAGNYGGNVFFDCSADSPGILYVNDFDNNGTSDPIFTCDIGGVRAPFVGRDLFCEHMPEFNNKFLTYTKYATTPFDSFFTAEKMVSATKKIVTELRSGYFENLGGGQFAFRPFAPIAQLAPIYGMQLLDANNDGHMDVLIAGNSNSDHFLFGDADASHGLLLLNDGKGNFAYKQYHDTGFSAKKYARGVAKVSFGGHTYYLVANNNDAVEVYRYNENLLN